MGVSRRPIRLRRAMRARRNRNSRSRQAVIAERVWECGDMTKEQLARKKRARIAKHEGDDVYSWALFIDGRVAYNGMSRSEATWRRDRFIMENDL